MSHPVFEQVRQNDSTVHRMLRAGRTLEEIIAVLSMEKQVLTGEIVTLKLQQPITYVVPNDLADTWKGMIRSADTIREVNESYANPTQP